MNYRCTARMGALESFVEADSHLDAAKKIAEDWNLQQGEEVHVAAVPPIYAFRVQRLIMSLDGE